MWININDNSELNLITDMFANFSDSFIEKIEFITDTSLMDTESTKLVTDKTSFIHNINNNYEIYENSEVNLTVYSQVNFNTIILKFKNVVEFKYYFSSNYDNILNDNTIEFKGYRFHFKNEDFSITSKFLEYKII